LPQRRENIGAVAFIRAGLPLTCRMREAAVGAQGGWEPRRMALLALPTRTASIHARCGVCIAKRLCLRGFRRYHLLVGFYHCLNRKTRCS